MSVKLMSLSEAQKSQGFSMLLYAKPKVGKTTFLSTLPGKTLIVDFERGWQVIKETDNIDVILVEKEMSNWKEVWDYISTIEGYDFICLDSITDMFKHMILAYSAVSKNNGKPTQSNYLEAYIKIDTILRTFRDLKDRGISVVATALELTITEQQNDGVFVGTKHPKLPEKIVQDIEGLFDVIARLEISQKEGQVGTRYLRLDGTQDIVAGNRINNKKFCVADMTEFLKEEKGEENGNIETTD